jgi:hypothetical protein
MGDIVITPASNDVNSTAGTLIIRTSDAQAMSLKTSDTDRVYITSAGNVGIGLTNPASKLHVSGAAATIMRLDSNTLTSVAQFQAKANTDGVLIAGMYGPNPVAGTVFGANTSGAAFLGTTTLGAVHPTLLAIGTSNTIPIIFGTNDIERMRIAGAGNVGIGTTNPSTKLHVYGAGGGFEFGVGSSNCYIEAIDRAATAAFINTSYYTRGTGYFAWNNGSYTERMRIDGAGNVGISTTSPTATLQVGSNSISVVSDNSVIARIGGSSAGGKVFNLTLANTATATTNNESALSFIVAGNYSATAIISAVLSNTTAAQTDLVFTNYNNGLAERMRINSSGNVGIGSTTPGAKLDVVGNINIDGSSFYRIANDSIITAPSDHGLVAYYGFDEGSSLSISDKTGRNNTSALGLTYTTTAIRGTALDGFGGNDNYVIVPDSTDFDFGTGDFAVSLWCRPNGSFTGVNNTLIEIGLYTAGILIRPQANTNTLEIYIQGSFITQPTLVWAANVWYHIVVTRVSSVLSVYSNGTRIASVANTSNIQVSSAGYIGRSAHAVGQFFYGIIDEVKIYKGKGLDYGEVRGQYLSRGDSTLVAPIFSNTNGYVGIGTTSLGNPLEVYGTSMDPSLTPSAASIFNVNSLGVELAVGRMVTSPFSLWLQGKHATVGGDLSYPIVLNPLGGNVGIGLTNPVGKLTVQGNIEVNYNSTTADTSVRRSFLTAHATINRGANITFGLLDGGSVAAGMTVNNAAAAAGAYNSQFITFNTHEGGVNEGERMRITSLGNVGIGTFTPLSLLTVGEASSTTAAKGLSFGGDASANLYRSAASTIKTDGSLEVATSLNIGADLYVADELGVGVQIANKRVTYGAQISAASASIQLVLGRTASATGQGAIGADSANTFAVWNVSGGFTKQLVVTQQGRVGIGTDVPGAKLDVNGDVYVSPNTAGKNTFILSTNASNDARLLMRSDVTTKVDIQANGTSYFNGGNVGIGLTNPSHKLDIYQTSNDAVIRSKTTAAGAYAYLDSATIGYYGINLLNAGTSKWFVGGYGTTSFTITKGIGVNEYFRIDTNGNVGIGTDNPTAKLVVMGEDVYNYAKSSVPTAIVADSVPEFLIGSTDNIDGEEITLRMGSVLSSYYTHGAYVKAIQGAGVDYYKLAFGTSNGAAATTKMSIDNVGNVGIGITNPGDKFQVNLNSGENILANIRSNGVSANNKVSFRLSELGTASAEFSLVRDGTSYQAKLQTVNNQPLSFGTNSVTRMVIDIAGNVGIGTAVPTVQTNYKFLQVNGTNSAIIEAMVNNVRIGGIDSDSSSLYFGSIGSFPIVFRTAVVEKMRITAAGLVGIGTATPTTLLSVGGAGSVGPASGLTFGGDAQANLYRVSEDIIKTDATLQVAGNFDGLGTVQAIGSILHRSTIRVLNKAATDWVTWFTRDTSESETIGRLDNIRSINGSVAGNLGIGTTLPSGKLHVVSTVAGATVLRTDGTNGTLFSVVDDLSDSLMSVNNSAGLPVLEVFADDRVVAGQYGSGDFVLINNKVGLGTSNPANKLTVIGGASIGSSTYNTAAPSNGLIVQGNVGIGLTNPTYKLEVAGGDVNIAGANVLRFGTVAVLNTASSPNDIYANIRVLRNESTVNTDGMYIGYNNGGTTSAHLRFYANAGNERMRIQANDGHVGIGTDTAAGRLDVYNDTNGEHVLFVRNNSAGVNAYSAIVLRRNGNTNGLVMFTNSSNRTTDGGAGNSTIRTDNGKLLVGAGATTYHSFETNGNVGIGLTNPAAARLHIKTDNTNPALRIEDPTILGPAGGTASKTFAGWLPIMTGAAVGDKVFIPLFK